MLIYFKKEEVVINTENIFTIQYSDAVVPHLHFSGCGTCDNFIDVLFNTKAEALSILHFIAYEYDKDPKQILTIHTDK